MRVQGIKYLVMEENLIWGDEHTMQCTYDVLLNCIPETYLLTNVTQLTLIKNYFSI